jgi:hypothetical protein
VRELSLKEEMMGSEGRYPAQESSKGKSSPTAGLLTLVRGDKHITKT